MSKYEVGDRVMVLCPGLAMLRHTYAKATGSEAPPNHHGHISELGDEEGLYLVQFDDGQAAPYVAHQIRPLEDSPATPKAEDG